MLQVMGLISDFVLFGGKSYCCVVPGCLNQITCLWVLGLNVFSIMPGMGLKRTEGGIRGWGVALVKHWVLSPAPRKKKLTICRVVFSEPSNNWKVVLIGKPLGIVAVPAVSALKKGSWRLSFYRVCLLIRLVLQSTENMLVWPQCGLLCKDSLSS